MDTINTDVIIIGAGPTGLSLACQFIRYGIDFVVVEKNESFHALFESDRRSGADAGDLRATRTGPTRDRSAAKLRRRSG